MTTTAPTSLDFGDAAQVDQALSAMVHRLRGSAILKTAAEVRAMIASGKPVCNLTAGDFDPKQFPIPEPLRRGIVAALEQGETNYPPSEGLLPLRAAIRDYVAREQGVTYPMESVLVAAGGRPLVYAAFRAVLDPGDTVVYAVPSWNNDYYADIVGARAVEVAARRENGFQPTLAELAPHLAEANLLCLCTPGNPTGTVMAEPALREVLEAVVAENARRMAAGKRLLFVLFDQMYGTLAFPPAEHRNALAVVPESAPYVMALDGVSKAFAGTGLRVGWILAAAPVVARIKDFLGHVGAWAPRPEQAATAAFLRDEAAVTEFRTGFHRGIRARLDALYHGFSALRGAGFPVDCIEPQGAIYLSLQLALIGKRFDGRPITTNEDIRQIMLQQAGLGVVPFQAFGLAGDTGWFRMSVGAVSLADIDAAFPRIRAFLDRID
ncbi:MAG: pyridoxal phosphate-dependent aminotransferase [Gemmatimonadales bacterium]